MPIKSGQYGKYYEWTENGKVMRVSLQVIPDWTPYKKNYNKSELALTEDDCAKLVAGEPVICKILISGGYKEVECKINEYTDKKNGGTKYAIKATTKREIYDRDILAEYIKNGHFKVEGNTLAKVEENFTEQLKQVPISIQDKLQYDTNGWQLHIYHSEVKLSNGEIIVHFDFSPGSFTRREAYGGLPKFPFWLKFDENYQLISTISEEEFTDLVQAEKVLQKQKEEAKRAEEHQNWIDEVNKRPWKERTLEDAPVGFSGGTVDTEYADLITRLQEKYPDKDVKKMVLFRYKKFQSYSNPSHKTIESRGWTSYLIKDILPGLTPSDVCGMVERGWVDFSISEYSFEGDADVTHTVKVEALPTD